MEIKCKGMGIPIEDDTLYRLLFADDQVIIVGDREDANYMLPKLQDELQQYGLVINTKKTEYIAVGACNFDEQDLGSEMGDIKH